MEDAIFKYVVKDKILHAYNPNLKNNQLKLIERLKGRLETLGNCLTSKKIKLKLIFQTDIYGQGSVTHELQFGYLSNQIYLLSVSMLTHTNNYPMNHIKLVNKVWEKSKFWKKFCCFPFLFVIFFRFYFLSKIFPKSTH